jgi:RNA polymerase sigma-70 factor (ECF subfamily)
MDWKATTEEGEAVEETTTNSRMMDNNSDDLARLRLLDPSAVTLVHQRYYSEIFRYARYRLNDDAAADDIASEVFLRLLDSIKAGKGPKTTLRGWLMGTTANLVSDYYRKAYAQPLVDLHENLHDSSSSPSDWAEATEQNQLLQAALRQLTADQQHILALRFGSGYSLEEVSAITGKKVNAVKALQFRALVSLKKNMTGPVDE